jgi:hypothetical protein
MAQRLQLNTGIPEKSFSPFDIQMSRRIWWQVTLLDSRSAQLAGTRTPQMVEAEAQHVPLPLNLDDADLQPEMRSPPLAQSSPTEMLFCLIRYEIGRFWATNGKRLHSSSTSTDEKDQLVDELEAVLETRYIRYYDPAHLIHLLAVGGARTALCKMRLVIYHPSNYGRAAAIPRSVRERLLAWSTKMIEYDVIGQRTGLFDNFSWHLDAHFPLDAFVFMLIEARHQLAAGPTADRVWNLVGETFRFRARFLDSGESELYAAVRSLTLRSWEAREVAVARLGQEIAVPPVITQLRERRAAAAAESGATLPSHCEEEMQGISITWQDGSSDNAALANELSGWEDTDWQFWDMLQEQNVVQ